MQNPFFKLITHTNEAIVVNVNQIVCMKRCTNHPSNPGEPDLLTEIKLNSGDTIYISDSIEDLYSRIEGL